MPVFLRYEFRAWFTIGLNLVSKPDDDSSDPISSILAAVPGSQVSDSSKQCSSTNTLMSTWM